MLRKSHQKYYLTLCFVLTSILVNAQTQKQFLTAGNESFESGNYYEAIYYFKEALKFKANEEAQYLIAFSFYELKEYDKAVNEFEKIKNENSYPLTNYYLANSLKIQGNYLKAIEKFESFKNNYRTDDFFLKKATQEIQSCYWALEQKENNNIKINHFPKPINTPYSDFSANYFIDSSSFILSSLIPKEPKNLQSEFISKLYIYEETDKGWKKSTLPIPIIEDSEHIANSYFLNEKNELYFSACNTIEGKIKCNIFVAKWKNNNWSEIVELNINDSIYTTTQPMVYVDFDGKKNLYFASNRNNAYNHTDLYFATETSYGQFSDPEKISNNINTIDNESSPYFDKENNVLYFSSEWHYGFGGFDIFSSELINNQWLKPKNFGLPINSSAHDQYYYPQNTDKAFFSSNRSGSMQLKGAACCFDIFETEYISDEIDSSYLAFKKDEILDEKNSGFTSDLSLENKATSSDINRLQSMLPAVVYFHNDEPEPKTTLIKTKLNYEESYNSYLSVRYDYYKNFNDKKALDNFFKEKVDKGFENLQKFSSQLLNELKQGKKIQLTLEGYCSPLALNDYNINLAKRRIVNLQNYLLSWNSGALRPYFNQGYLLFIDAPFGEEKAPEGISDSLLELDKSVYSPKASAERKVAIIFANEVE